MPTVAVQRLFQSPCLRHIAPLFVLAVIACDSSTIRAFDANPKLDDYIARLERVNAGYTAFKQEQQRLVERIAALNVEIQKSRGELDAVVDESAKLPGRIDFNQLKIEELRRDRGQSNRRKIDDLRRTNNELSNRLKVNEARIAQERSRIKELAADHSKASDSLAKVRTQYRDQFDEFYKLADPYGRFSMGELPPVIAKLTQFIIDDNENQGAFLIRGIANRHLGAIAEAESDFNAAIEAEGPLRALAYISRAELRIAFGTEREGRLDIGNSTKLMEKQTDSRVVVFRCWILLGDKKYSAAQSDLKKALRLGGSDADAHRLLALVYIALPDTAGNTKASIEHASRACEITKSEDWLSLEALAAAQAAAGDFESAVATIGNALSLASDENRKRCEASLMRYQEKQPPDLASMLLTRPRGDKPKAK